MAGFDPRDSTSIHRPVEPYSQMLDQPVKGKTIGLPKQWWNERLPSEQANIGEQALAVFRDLGVNVVEVDLPPNPLGL